MFIISSLKLLLLLAMRSLFDNVVADLECTKPSDDDLFRQLLQKNITVEYVFSDVAFPSSITCIKGRVNSASGVGNVNYQLVVQGVKLSDSASVWSTGDGHYQFKLDDLTDKPSHVHFISEGKGVLVGYICDQEQTDQVTVILSLPCDGSQCENVDAVAGRYSQDSPVFKVNNSNC